MPAAICASCYKQYAQYTCPKCNIRYCSLVCYKSHNEKCTTDFMRESAEGMLKGMRSSGSSRAQIEKSLQKIHALDLEEINSFQGEEPMVTGSAKECSSSFNNSWVDGLTEAHVEEIIQACNSSDLSMLESALPPHIAEEFRLEISRGVGDLLVPWEPWWESIDARYLSLSPTGTWIVEPSCVDASDAEPLSCLPHPPMSPLPSVRQVTTAETSSTVRWNVLDLLVLVLSQCLSSASPPPETCKEAVGNLLQVATTLAGGSDRAFILGVFKDVRKLLDCGRPTILLALADLKYWLEQCKSSLKELPSQSTVDDCTSSFQALLQIAAGKEMEASKGVTRPLCDVATRGKKNRGKNSRVELAKKKLQFAIRKTWFLMAWTNDQDALLYCEMLHALDDCLDEVSQHYMGNSKARALDVNTGM